MTEVQIMERNLAKMLREHQSVSDLEPNQPVDPFQKRQFGKKMRKSSVTVVNDHIRNSSLPHLDSHNLKSQGTRAKTHKNGQEPTQRQQDYEIQYYKGEVESLMTKLRLTLQRVQENYKGKISSICRDNIGRDRQVLVQNLLGSLQGSIQFIVNDCLNTQEQARPAKCSVVRHDVSNKQNQNSQCNITLSSVDSKPVRQSTRPAKSIYEAVLEQRGMRRSKRKAP